MTERDLIRKTLKRVLGASSLRREQVAERVAELTGLPLSERILNGYLAESQEDYRWPAELELALCQVLNDYSLLAERVERAGFRMIGPAGEKLIEIGRAFLQRVAADRLLKEAESNG